MGGGAISVRPSTYCISLVLVKYEPYSTRSTNQATLIFSVMVHRRKRFVHDVNYSSSDVANI